MNEDTKNDIGVKAINEAMSGIFSDIRAIEKSKTNKFFNFKFRGIDDVYATFHPIFAEHHVFLLIELLEHITEDRPTREGKTLHHIVKVRFTFRSGIDGSEVSSVTIGESSDTGDKGATKAMSIALKYLMFQTFLVPVDAPADDNDSSETVFANPADQKSPSTDELKSCGEAKVPVPDSKQFGKKLNEINPDTVYWWADEWVVDKGAPGEWKNFKISAQRYADYLDSLKPADGQTQASNTK